jgi:osmotically-inducible protein OsmY
MSHEDQSVGAKVKALLVRKGVDLSEAGFGVTNGVVTFTGSLCSSRNGDDGLQSVVQEIALARWLNRQLKRVSGVRDVVFQLDRVRKDGARFKPR